MQTAAGKILAAVAFVRIMYLLNREMYVLKFYISLANMYATKFRLLKGHKEAAIWAIALLLLAWQPFGNTSLCGVHWLGFTYCPGCGIGTSIAHVLQGNFGAAWHAHYFGIPAVLIILARIFHLLKSNIHFKNTRTP